MVTKPDLNQVHLAQRLSSVVGGMVGVGEERKDAREGRVVEARLLSFPVGPHEPPPRPQDQLAWV